LATKGTTFTGAVRQSSHLAAPHRAALRRIAPYRAASTATTSRDDDVCFMRVSRVQFSVRFGFEIEIGISAAVATGVASVFD